MGNYGFSSGWRAISAPIRINEEASGQKGVPFWETPSLCRGDTTVVPVGLFGKSRGNPMEMAWKNQHSVQMSYFEMGVFFLNGVCFNNVWYFVWDDDDSPMDLRGQGHPRVQPRSPAGAAQRCQATFADGVCFGGAACGGCETRMKSVSFMSILILGRTSALIPF